MQIHLAGTDPTQREKDRKVEHRGLAKSKRLSRSRRAALLLLLLFFL